MNRLWSMLVIILLLCAATVSWSAEPLVYTIKKGDTLWGLSQRFLNDPNYWPNLWSRNPTIGNPHFIYPGQKIKVFPDRIEIVPATPPTVVKEEVPVEKEEVAAEQTFMVSGGEGFLAEKGLKPIGFISTTNQHREVVGEDDIVYTDIGRKHGVKVGDRFSIFSKMESVSHPVTNAILGNRVIPLGVLQLTEVEEDVSKAIITRSYQEIGPGAYLMPYVEPRRDVSLKIADKDMQGYIVATRTGNNFVGAGDVVYLDLGRKQGIEPGNFLYVVRDVDIDHRFDFGSTGKLPVEVLGAVVVVEIAEQTSTALIVKSIDTLCKGDRVELKKGK